MKKRLAIALSSAVFVAVTAGFASCGGQDSQTTGFGWSTLHVRGAANEDLLCFAAAFDASQADAGTTWTLDMPCYRNITDIDMAAGLGLILAHAPDLGKAYAFDAAATPVANDPAIEMATAQRIVGMTMSGGQPVTTHQADYVYLGAATGALSFTITSLPAPNDPMLTVHGSVTGTLPETTDGGSPGPVTIDGTF